MYILLSSEEHYGLGSTIFKFYSNFQLTRGDEDVKFDVRNL
jgi:hypothetical protein